MRAVLHDLEAQRFLLAKEAALRSPRLSDLELSLDPRWKRKSTLMSPGRRRAILAGRETAGGASPAGTLVALGQDGTGGIAALSVDGINWTFSRTGLPNSAAQSLASNGSVLVAATSNANDIAYSSNGLSWTTVASGTGGANTVCWDSVHGVFVAIGSGASATSATGASWSAGGSTTSNYIASAAGGGVIVAAGSASARFSSNGAASWSFTGANGPTQVTGSSFAYSPDLGLFVGGSSAVDETVSSNGSTWVLASCSIVGEPSATVWAHELSLFCAIAATNASNGAITSPNGTTWTSQTTPTLAGGPFTMRGLAWNRAVFAAIGPSGILLTSPNGVTWTNRTPLNSSTTTWGAICLFH